ncbi:MAG: PAS domain S-box protein [Bacteroidetes bacterium]|nr:PAS domain S-box protein [Bacteroidota bacterium]
MYTSTEVKETNTEKNSAGKHFPGSEQGIIKENFAMKFLIMGFIILTVSLFIGFWAYDFRFSLSTIKQMHVDHPAMFIFWLLPVILYLGARKYSAGIIDEKKKAIESLEERNREIDHIAGYVKKIGKGDLSAVISDLNKQDVLAESLLALHNNLMETRDKEKKRSWMSKGKDIISDALLRNNDIESVAYDVLEKLSGYTGLIMGAFYIYDDDSGIIRNIAAYACDRKKYMTREFRIGQGLIGQAAGEMDMIYRTELPVYYDSVTSGLINDKKPESLLIMPMINEEKLQGVLEFADVADHIPELTRQFIREISVIIAQTVFNLKTNIRTEKLLREAQALAAELRENEEKLMENAEEMRITHKELEKTNKQLEEKVAEVQNAQKRLYSLLENASEVISIYGKDKTILYESPSVKNILGYDAEDVIGKKGFLTVSDEDKMLFEDIFSKLIEDPSSSRSTEITYTKSDGSLIYLEFLGRNLLDNPAIGGIIFNIRDITQRKIAEKEQRMRGQMQALSENSPDMILRLGISGKIFYTNPMVEKYTGLKSASIYKKKFRDAGFNETILALFSNLSEKIMTTGTKTDAESMFITPLGERIMQVNAIPEFGENGELETILIVAHDITERKQIELEIQDKNKKIENSINYAQRIQNSILPDTKQIRKFLPDSFILYEPRDVISGDFPWFFERNGIIYIAAVDCTGHGVPGALLSFIGYFSLNNIVDHERELSSGRILDLLHTRVRKTLKQERSGAEARDGMDIAFCKINLKKKKLEFSGAHRPLYLLRNRELIQYKGNPKAIGGIPVGKKPETEFVTYEINIMNKDKIFFFSDGLPDQIGGPDRRKYQAKRIREALVENADVHVTKFSDYFAGDFRQWKGENKQIDDVLLIGIEFNS